MSGLREEPKGAVGDGVIAKGSGVRVALGKRFTVFELVETGFAGVKTQLSITIRVIKVKTRGGILQAT